MKKLIYEHVNRPWWPSVGPLSMWWTSSSTCPYARIEVWLDDPES